MQQVPLIIRPDADDPDFAAVMVDVTVAGRAYRLMLDTGAARTALPADEYTSALHPVGTDTSAGAFGRRLTYPVVAITDLVLGPLRVAKLEVRRAHGTGQMLGMDVLGQCCCRFRLNAAMLDLGAVPGIEADHALMIGRGGHVYVDVRWPGVTARACWDTGAGATVVNREFWLTHPGLFEQIGMSAGTDGSGDRNQTPLLLMSGPVIGQRRFSGHKAVAADLSPVNRALDYPMDLILGYPTIRQADWLFDFPARRWTLTG